MRVDLFSYYPGYSATSRKTHVARPRSRDRQRCEYIMKGGRVVSICGFFFFLLFLVPLRCLYPDGEYLKQLVTVRCLCRSFFEFGFKQFGEKKSVLPCSTLPTLTNLRCLAQPVNNTYGIAVDYPLSCWCWNNAIAPSHHSNLRSGPI